MEALNRADLFKIVLDLITKIQEFDGNSKQLVDFLDRIDAIAPTIDSFEDEAKFILTGYIKDRIVGRAKVEIQKHGRVNTWSEIKSILKTNYSLLIS